MFSNKFIVSVLVEGQVKKELANGECHIPFGEYSLRLRNKNNRRAVCKVFVDGEKCFRNGYIVPANSYIDLECSSRTNRKFKFVDLQSTEAQEFGKDQTNSEKKMGLIETHWYLEKEKPLVKEVHRHHYPTPRPYPVYPHKPWYPCEPYGPWLNSSMIFGGDQISAESCKGETLPNVQYSARNQYVNCTEGVRDGATVEGGHSNQRFGKCNVDMEEYATIIKLYLQGYDGEVLKIAVDYCYCDKCGAKSIKKSSNFCHICGNKLN